VNGIDDGDAGGELAEIGATDKISDEGIDGKRAQRKRPEQNDAGMGAGGYLRRSANSISSVRSMRCSSLAACAISVSGWERRCSSAAVRTS
jgi:hypothetical protein